MNIGIIGTGKNANMLLYELSKEHTPVLIDPKHKFPNAEKYINGVTSFTYWTDTYELLTDIPLYTYKQKSSVTSNAVFEEGTYVGPNVVVDHQTVVGRSCWISRGSTIGHDCKIGNNVFVGPDVTICGSVVIGDGSFIGAKSLIYDNTQLPAKTVLRGASVWK